MAPIARQNGALLLMAALLLSCFALVIAMAVAATGSVAERDRITERALAQAREALIAYAADRPIGVEVGPGYLPCPDLDNDGWAESTCGSLNGDTGQEQRLGRLPWKTLGLPDLRDGSGERLWYAVSSKYKGLLNCAASRACIDMTPDMALGAITVRDRTGVILNDGTIGEPYRANEGGALAVVIAPGPPLRRIDANGADERQQVRECRADECDALGRCTTSPPQLAARCNPLNFLDKAPGAIFDGEDNADFVDRHDDAGRPRNRNGFVQGPIAVGDGRIAVNDRLAVIGYRDVMPRIMTRVAIEVAHCLRYYGARPENGGRYPWPTPVCMQSSNDATVAWRGERGVFFGRIPDTPFADPGAMLPRWWRAASRSPENPAELPTANDACRIAIAPGDGAAPRKSAPGNPADEGETAGHSANAWWTAWKPYVFYALARNFAPSASAAGCQPQDKCVATVDASGGVIASGKQFAVLVAGAALARTGGLQSHAGFHIGDATQWLEEGNARVESASSCLAAPACGTDCNRLMQAAATRTFNDVVVTYP